MRLKAPAIFAAAACAALLAGCETLGYYTQAIGGQFELSRRAQPIDALMGDPATPAELRAKLTLAREIREYASRSLGLPDNESYRRYADLGRPFVVWNVVAAEEFSTKAVESCFPVVGCVTYRGYFGEADARAHAEALRVKGFDVQVSGIPAYSTLGWFDDPLLSTFIRYPEAELARLVFHELAHQVVYVKGDTIFNESFAVAVERAGVRRWLEANQRGAANAAFLAGRERQREFIALIEAAKARLDAVYAQKVDPAAMRIAKREAFDLFLQDYAALKVAWGGFAGYDRIVGAAPGNALLASITAYSKYVPGFERTLDAEGGDLAKFYAAVKRLAALPDKERCAALSSAGCSPPR
jgi:predicted aminopeptidase